MRLTTVRRRADHGTMSRGCVAVMLAILLGACSGDEDTGASPSAASGGGAAGTGSAAGGGGAGAGEACTTAASCGDDDECITQACVSGICKPELAPAGTPVVAGAVFGDCKATQCDGKGKIAEVDDEDDVPNDFNPCTDDACDAGSPVHTPVTDGTVCSTRGPNLVCQGGKCTGCKTNSQCPQGDTCMKAICDKQGSAAGVCGFEIAVGQEVENADPTDCFHSVCDERGAVVVAVAPGDVPVQDGNTCDDEVCDERGMVIHAVLADGTACDAGTFCNPSACTSGTCIKGRNPADGTLTPNQIGGDCVDEVCDGAGGVKSASTPAGTGCSTIAGGTCNGSGQCCDLVSCI